MTAFLALAGLYAATVYGYPAAVNLAGRYIDRRQAPLHQAGGDD